MTLSEFYRKIKEEGNKFNSYDIPLKINGDDFEVEFIDVDGQQPCSIDHIEMVIVTAQEKFTSDLSNEIKKIIKEKHYLTKI